MKNYTRYKRRLSLVLCIVMLVSCFSVNAVYGKTKLESAKDSLSAVQDKIKEISSKLKEGQKAESDYANQIEEIDLQISAVQAQIGEIQAQILVKEAEIQVQQQKLVELQNEIDIQNAALGSRLRTMYKTGETSILQIILGSSDLFELMTNIDMIQKIYENDKAILEEIKARYKIVEDQKKVLEQMKGELEKQKNDISQKEYELQNSKDAADELRRKIANSNEALESQIDSLNKTANDISATIRSLQTTGTTYTGGSMSWPAPGCYTVTSPYGYRIHPILNTKKLHTGVDIAAPTGTKIVAANSGKVIMSKYYGGYGNCVMIDHGGGIVTLYGHNSKLCVSEGQSVAKGATIALAGSTGQSTGPHCHFEVRINGSYTDPSPYIGI